MVLAITQHSQHLSKGQSVELPNALPQTTQSSVEDHLIEQSFTIKQITDYEIKDIEEFWENKENGHYCVSLFKEIVDMYEEIKYLKEHIDEKIDEYNENCIDKCFPGYVRCEGDYS